MVQRFNDLIFIGLQFLCINGYFVGAIIFQQINMWMFIAREIELFIIMTELLNTSKPVMMLNSAINRITNETFSRT